MRHQECSAPATLPQPTATAKQLTTERSRIPRCSACDSRLKKRKVGDDKLIQEVIHEMQQGEHQSVHAQQAVQPQVPVAMPAAFTVMPAAVPAAMLTACAVPISDLPLAEPVTESAQPSGTQIGSEGWNEVVSQLSTAMLELATARTELEAERAARLRAESALAEAKATAADENDTLRRETQKLKLEIDKRREEIDNSACISGLLVEKQRTKIALQREENAKLREENARLNDALLKELQQLQVPKVQVTLKVKAQVAPTPAAPAALAPNPPAGVVLKHAPPSSSPGAHAIREGVNVPAPTAAAASNRAPGTIAPNKAPLQGLSRSKRPAGAAMPSARAQGSPSSSRSRSIISDVCSACQNTIDLTATWHKCKLLEVTKDDKNPHSKSLHGHVMCRDVWMPADGCYFCNDGCIKMYNKILKTQGITAMCEADAAPSNRLWQLPVQRRSM